MIIEQKPKRRRRRKKAETKLVKFDWKKLLPGDIIKSKVGCGPYFIEKVNFEKINFNYFGYFRVYKLFNDAIGAYPYNNKKFHGFCTLYMGKEMISETTGIYRSPHKILKLVPNV